MALDHFRANKKTGILSKIPFHLPLFKYFKLKFRIKIFFQKTKVLSECSYINGPANILREKTDVNSLHGIFIITTFC